MLKAKHEPNPTPLLNFDEVQESSIQFQIPNFENCENTNFEVNINQPNTPKSSGRRLLNLISTGKVHKQKVNRRNFPESTSQQFDNSSNSSNQASIAQIEDDDDITDNSFDIEEIMQQIIALKDVNFEQISNAFPSLRRLLNSAEKHTVQSNETSLTQFSKMFPSTSNGPPILSINSSPVSNWLSNLTKELKSFF